jgi:glycosyltransferase involved in cell wall biosynthesis/GNAT superfamily N-acetyltransferase
MRVSVVIPSFNEASTIGRCIESVFRADTKKELADICIVDNGSTDNTVDVAKKSGATIRQNTTGKRKTIAALRNEGAANATGDLLVFLDADMLVPENWLSAATERYASGFSGILGFVDKAPDDAGLVARAWGNRLYRKRRRVMVVDFLPGRNMFVPARLFHELGGFDASLTTVEDKDLTMRAAKAGFEVLSSPEAPVVHLGCERDFAEFVRKEYWRQGSTLAVLGKRGLTLRGLRNPLLSLYHLLAPLAAMGFFLRGHGIFAISILLAWILPALFLTLRDAGAKDPLFPAVLWLTFVRWIVSGVALCHQILAPSLRAARNRRDTRAEPTLFLRHPRLARTANALKPVLRFFYHHACDTLSVLDLRHRAAAPRPQLRPGRKFQELSVGDLHDAAFAHFGQSRLERARSRFASCRGVAVWEQDRPVGWGFITTNPREREGWPPLTYAVRPGPGTAYLFDVFVAPENRSQGIAKDVILCCAHLAAETESATLFLTHSHPAMARIMRELGARKAGQLTYLRILGFAKRDLSALNQFTRTESNPSQPQHDETPAP